MQLEGLQLDFFYFSGVFCHLLKAASCANLQVLQDIYSGLKNHKHIVFLQFQKGNLIGY